MYSLFSLPFYFGLDKLKPILDLIDFSEIEFYVILMDQ